MSRWFQGTSDHGQVDYLPHPSQGYLAVERIGDYWHVPCAGRRTLFAERAQAMAEQVAHGAAPRQYVIDTPGRPMAVFAPDLVEPNVWVAAATRGGVVNIAAVLRVEDTAGNAAWQPLVENVDTGAYAEPEQAMAFALEAAHQRLDGNYGLHRSNGRQGASDRRHIQFQEAINAHAPRGNHKITRAEIRAVQILREVGFTPNEIASSMRWSPEAVADVAQRSLDDAHDRWIGQASQPGHALPRQRAVQASSAPAPSAANEARATVWARHPQGDVLFTAREGGATAQMRDTRRARTHALRIEPRTRSDGRAWQVMLNGRRLGAPQAKIPDAMSFAVNTLHERAQTQAEVKPFVASQNASARAQLEAAARNVPGLSAADRKTLAAGAGERAQQRAMMREQTSQKTVPERGGIAAILGMSRPSAAGHRAKQSQDANASSPDMGV
jgi:hypothetical protein